MTKASPKVSSASPGEHRTDRRSSPPAQPVTENRGTNEEGSPSASVKAVIEASDPVISHGTIVMKLSLKLQRFRFCWWHLFVSELLTPKPSFCQWIQIFLSTLSDVSKQFELKRKIDGFDWSLNKNRWRRRTEWITNILSSRHEVQLTRHRLVAPSVRRSSQTHIYPINFICNSSFQNFLIKRNHHKPVVWSAPKPVACAGCAPCCCFISLPFQFPHRVCVCVCLMPPPTPLTRHGQDTLYDLERSSDRRIPVTPSCFPQFRNRSLDCPAGTRCMHLFHFLLLCVAWTPQVCISEVILSLLFSLPFFLNYTAHAEVMNTQCMHVLPFIEEWAHQTKFKENM